MIKNYGFLLALFCFVSINYSQEVLKQPPSNWIVPVEVEDVESGSNDGAFKYLLIDYQDHIGLEQQYVHYGIKVLNSEGIQEFSDISASYDPAFQTLVFNKITVIRNGEKIDKLNNSKINTYQRETNLERSLYDGSITAVINLSDIRKGDIIEYAYTLKGFNPINKGNYSAVLYQQYTSPVHKISQRIITTKEKPIELKLLKGAIAPEKKNSNGNLEYSWDLDGTDYFQYDINVPYWLNLQKRVSVTTFKDWGALTQLIEPLYETKGQEANDVIPSLKNASSEEETILELIRFVQDDVRYLGFESGIGAYKPHSPKKVLEQRYGDCKDKSLLLVSLLKNAGVTSYPFLVNTETKESLGGLLPGLNLFNHCIVYFEHEGNPYYVDPTMTNQGGNLANLHQPQYGEGLLLKPNNKGLSKIPENKSIPSVKVEETITTDSIGGKAIFLVKSTYTGSKADYMRDYFKSNTQESINTEFTTFYSSLYPSIQSTQPIRFTDNSRNGINEFVIEEYYNIPSFWVKDEESGLHACETQPMVLQSMIEYTKTPNRTMPYYLGEPYNFEQETTIALPEFWNAPDRNFVSDKESYRYQNQVRTIGKTISVKHSYALKKNQIAGNQAATFLLEHEKINDQIAYQLTYNAENASGETSGVSWMSLLISALTIGLCLFGAKKIYEKYNPMPESNQSLSLGGWLVLPGIGLVLSPFILIFQIANQGYFNSGVWSLFKQAGYENHGSMTILLGVEFVVNLAILVFTILLIVLYFKKRTSLPKLMVIYYGANLLFPIIDVLLYSSLFPQELLDVSDDSETYKQIGRGLVAAAIWIPYFLVSQRVKDTFTAVHPKEELMLQEVTTSTK